MRKQLFNDSQSFQYIPEEKPEGYIDPYRLYKAEVQIYGEPIIQPPKEKDNNNIRVRQQYKELRRQFKLQNHQTIQFSELILKQTKPRSFYPMIKNRDRNTANIDLKNQNRVQIQSSKNMEQYIDFSIKILLRTGKNSLDMKQEIFTQFEFQPSSIQIETIHTEFPQSLFFCFDADLSKEDIIKYLADEANDEGPSKENPKKKMEKQIKKLGFIELCHTILGKEYLPKYAWNNGTEEKEVFIEDEFLEQWEIENNKIGLEFVTNEEVFQACPPNLYIQNVNILRKHKQQMEIASKKLNIRCEEYGIVLDIRNTLQSQKIYFIQMMEESRSAVKLAETAQSRLKNLSIDIIKQIYEVLINKSKQFLLLACTFLPSSIEIDVRVKNLFQYLTSNFMYSQTLLEPHPDILKTSHVLQSWYKIPQKNNLFGYSIKQVKEQIYKLIRKSCIMKKQLEYHLQYKQIRKVIEETQKKSKKSTKSNKSQSETSNIVRKGSTGNKVQKVEIEK